jgi:Transposase DDE domain group 1
LTVAQRLLKLQRLLREPVWEAANVQLPSITLDTDTTVHTLYGRQMGGRKSYNPKNKGKKSYQPILTFIAETREYIGGELRNGDRPTGKQIARHLEAVFAAVPQCVREIFARAAAGFYCHEAVVAYEKAKASFLIVARKTARLLEELEKADWRPSPKTDADEQCEFKYQSEGLGEGLLVHRPAYQKRDEAPKEQYPLFETPEYIYRVFVTDMKDAIELLV